jgi:metallo-beta-lactamase family protein
MDNNLKLIFLGANQTVTGSKYLIESDDKKVLVDCGLFQGYKELRERNWQQLPISAWTIDAVILTHAHIDHSGYLPLLVKNGFVGKIYCSPATYDLCSLLLPDSGHIHEEDARQANKHKYTRHKPALPLYTKKDAVEALKYFHLVDFDQIFYIGKSLYFILSRSGHILGSSFVSVFDGKNKIVFSGDLGRPNDPMMNPRVTIDKADYIVIESTYGDKLHEKTDPAEEMGELIRKTAEKGGKIVIPAFAVGRTQEILYYIYKLKQSKSIPDIQVFLDSPMAINATNLLHKYIGEHKMSKHLCHDVCGIATYTTKVEESRQINNIKMPCIIISASGMATDGRILYHLENLISDSKNTIIFAGYQAGGTRGDRLLRGEKTLKIHGKTYNVRAKIECLSSLSAHADYQEILDWLSNFKQPPKKIFITHGELASAVALQNKIQKQFGWITVIPAYLQSENL